MTALTASLRLVRRDEKPDSFTGLARRFFEGALEGTRQWNG